jgi:DNA-binding MarR family transcriptional regulator
MPHETLVEPTPAKTQTRKTPAPASLTVWTGYLLSRAAQQCQEYFDGLMETSGLRARHFRLMALLGEADSLSQVEIGERLNIDRNTIVLLLDDLEALGCVTRRRDPRDRRAHCVSLTETGKKQWAHGLEMARRTNEAVFAPLESDERTQLHALLLRLL